MELTELISKFTVKKSDKVAKILEPLKRVSSIEGFFYYTLDKKGSFTFLGSHPAWMEEYYEEKYYLHNPFLCHPSTLQEGFHFPNTVRDEQYLEMLALRQKRIDADHAMMLINKIQGDVEAFCFFTKTANSKIYNFYMNEKPLLLSFIDYFKSEMQEDLKLMKKFPANLAAAKKRLFYLNGNEEIVTDSARYQFLKSIGKDVDWLISLKLTKRERQILQFLRLGKTAQETAGALFLSSRTVEKYFENIKFKLQCERRSEMFDRLMELEQLGFKF